MDRAAAANGSSRKSGSRSWPTARTTSRRSRTIAWLPNCSCPAPRLAAARRPPVVGRVPGEVALDVRRSSTRCFARTAVCRKSAMPTTAGSTSFRTTADGSRRMPAICSRRRRDVQRAEWWRGDDEWAGWETAWWGLTARSTQQIVTPPVSHLFPDAGIAVCKRRPPISPDHQRQGGHQRIWQPQAQRSAVV